MECTGLNGRKYRWNLKKSGRRDKCSQYHQQVRDLLKSLYPFDVVLEEVLLPGSDKLRVDFYIPGKNLIVEIHGKQHYEFVPHFHGSRAGFINSLKRDNNKKQWAEINGIRFAELKFDEPDTWSEIVCSVG